jgi:hypothetical protein
VATLLPLPLSGEPALGEDCTRSTVAGHWVASETVRMGERRVLVIGSQCAALPNNHLAFLPGMAEELYQVLTDPALGGCVPALENHNKSLLIDPTIAVADSAIVAAMARASQDAASLFVAFVGHGERAEDDFYLLPYDASLPPDSATALFIAKRLQELLRRHDRLDGLVLLIDTCYSGAGTLQAATHWPRTIDAAGGRFEVLSAAAADRPAFDGCFTATLTALLRTGVPKLGENLRCSELHGADPRPLRPAGCYLPGFCRAPVHP